MNAGRRRRATTSIEELSQTLDDLESRFRRPREEREDPRWPPRPGVEAGYRDHGRERDRRPLAREPRAETLRPPHREPETGRGIAVELERLREDLRAQMGSGLRREFAALKDDIEKALKAPAPAAQTAGLGVEFERLSGMIQEMAERGDDRQINLLRLEMEEVKAALGKLAREETLHSFDRRWSELAGKAGRHGIDDEAFGGLMARLEQVGEAIDSLPDSVTLRSLEDKMKTLAAAVEQFSHRRDLAGSQSLATIEERLDEISRAVAASTAALQPAPFDPQPFERIEARISSLARQINEVVEENPASALADQLSGLSLRVDEIGRRVDMPGHAVERLAERMDEIARRLDSGPVVPDLGPALDGLEDRVASLAHLLEQRHEDALVQGRTLFHDIERRLEDVAQRMREADAPAHAEADLIGAIDARFAELADRLERRPEPRLDDGALRELEARLDSISTRIETSSSAPRVDADLIRSLEAQVAGLAAHIAAPAAPASELASIAPRLEKIENSILESRKDVVRAAREAAEEAVRSLSGGQAQDSHLVAGLMDDLKTLESLTRKSDDRNAKTFSAIHDTLLKIVDRLGAVEAGVAGGHRAASAPVRETALGAEHTPPLQPSIDAMPIDPADQAAALRGRQAQMHRSAATAAAEAAADALREGEGDARDEVARGRLSMLGGLTRALSGRKARKDEPPAEAPKVVPPRVEPAIDVDAPLDPKLANQPLEPGSGAPDLNAIMKRVRDERGQPVRGSDADAAKSDFIAAARRAAQAAAAEAEVMKRGPVAKGQGKGAGLGGLLKRRSKPVLMGVAAILMALAALQIGKSFTGGGSEVAEVASPAPVVAEAMPATAAAADDAPAEEIVTTPDAASAVDEAVAQTVRMARSNGPDETARSLLATPPASAEAVTTDWLDGPAAAPVAAAPEPAAEIEEVLPQPDAGVMASIPVEAGPVALREAASAGDPKALFEIGNRYDDGRGVAADKAKAAEWYERAAEEGFAPAQYRIGNMLENGVGVERDVAKAKTWYQLAAAQGNASAMHNLAVLFAMGADGTTDNESAVRWFGEAAQFGVTDSQYNLGILSAKGVGMEQNLEEAYKWFALVAKAGDKDAAAKRDEIANAMRPEQLERARATTDLWRAKPVDPEANVVEVPDSWRESEDTTASVDMKQAVLNIQQILNANGYDAGTEDGVMGRKTRAAISKFQTENGMAATGAIDEPLVRALLARR